MKNTSALFGMVLAGAMTLPVAASPALANVITFETAPFGVQFFGPVTEDGFTYSLLFGALHATSSGIPGQDMEGFAVSRFLQGGVLKIVKADGGNFVFDSLNFAVFASFGGGSQTLDVNGSVPIRLTQTPTRASVGHHGGHGHPAARRSGFSPVAA